MIVVLKRGAEQDKREQLINWLKNQGLGVHISEGEYQTVLGLIGDTARVDMDLIESLSIVDSVKRVTEPFKCCNRKFHPDDMIVQVGDVKVGGGNFCMIAGPCSVESEEQIVAVAKAVKASGANMLRGGAFKPRTSPYDFQGLKAEGIELLKIARQETGLPIVTEIMGTNYLPLFEDVDVIQVGARNMQNFDLLRELGKLRKPILLKRGLASTLKELLMSAEYIMAGGNEQVILCERGIRTYDDYTRNTLDLAAVPMLKELTHLPVIVDPSHATGIARLVRPMALAAAAFTLVGILWDLSFPINKKLWTSSFVCVVAGYSLGMFALFYWIIDVKGYKGWVLPFQVIGLNSITIYMAQRIVDFKGISAFFFGGLAAKMPEALAPVVASTGYLLVSWLFLYFLYKKRIFLKV